MMNHPLPPFNAYSDVGGFLIVIGCLFGDSSSDEERRQTSCDNFLVTLDVAGLRLAAMPRVFEDEADFLAA